MDKRLQTLALLAAVAQGSILVSSPRSGVNTVWRNPQDTLERAPTPRHDVDAIKAAAAKRERRAARNRANAAKEFFPKRY